MKNIFKYNNFNSVPKLPDSKPMSALDSLNKRYGTNFKTVAEIVDYAFELTKKKKNLQ